MKLLITVDTEEDRQWDDTHDISSVENLKFCPRFQKLCERFGFPPTWLCTIRTIKSTHFAPLIDWHAKGKAELGTHLHPWSCPPFDETFQLDRVSKLYPCELPDEIFYKKMQMLTDTFKEITGFSPTSYRSGRWGMAPSHLKILRELGYITDASITPNVSWETTKGGANIGPDFSTSPLHPYHPANSDLTRRGNSQILELPMTILHTNKFFDKHKSVCDFYQRNQQRVLFRLLNRFFHLDLMWFRPYPFMTITKLKRVYQAAKRLKLPYVMLMLHSSELMPGCSPYNPDKNSIEYLYHRLENLFIYLQDEGIRGVTMSNFAQEFIQNETIND